MKYSLFAFLFIFSLSIGLVACESTEDQLAEPTTTYPLPSHETIHTLLDKSYTEDGYSRENPLSSFVAEGALEIFSGYDAAQQQAFLRIGLTEATKGGPVRTAVFEVHLDEEMDFTTLISAGKVIYLQNQLCLIDLSEGSATNFYVDDGIHTNAFPALPTVNSASLGLQRGEAAANQNLKSGN